MRWLSCSIAVSLSLVGWPVGADQIVLTNEERVLEAALIELEQSHELPLIVSQPLIRALFFGHGFLPSWPALFSTIQLWK